MLKPRNTLVLLRLHEKSEKKVQNIIVVTNGELYTEAEVIAVGPGNQMAAGAVSETADLKPGQLVQVKHKSLAPGRMGAVPIITGIEVRDGDDLYYLYEQTSITGILAEPGTWNGSSKPGHELAVRLTAEEAEELAKYDASNPTGPVIINPDLPGTEPLA